MWGIFVRCLNVMRTPLLATQQHTRTYSMCCTVRVEVYFAFLARADHISAHPNVLNVNKLICDAEDAFA